MSQLNKLLEDLKTYIKTNKYDQYNTSDTKFTGGNYNVIIKALSMAAEDIADLSSIIQNIPAGESYTDRTQIITKVQVQNLIKQSFEKFKSDITLEPLTIYTSDNNNEKVIYDGTTAKTITTIANAKNATIAASSTTAVSSTIAVSSNVSLSANLALSADLSVSSIIASGLILNNNYNICAASAVTAVSAQYVKGLNVIGSVPTALNASIAETAQFADQAGVLTSRLYWMDGNGNIDYYDGSRDNIISSLLMSVSAQFSQYASQSNISVWDSDNNIINTKSWHVLQTQNNDYPLLFADKPMSSIMTYEKGYSCFNNQILINPKYGILKANYFMGQALCSIFSVADKNGNLINTRVCQNYTTNNYEYPIALAYINNQAKSEDGYTNQIMYTGIMSLNPYKNIIYSNGTQQTLTNTDYSLWKHQQYNIISENNNIITMPSSIIDYSNQPVNFCGLATRALFDVSGNPLNRFSNLKYADPNIYNKEYPIIFSISGYNKEENTLSQLNFNKNLRVTGNGNLYINGITNINKDLVVESNCTIKGDMVTFSSGSQQDSTSFTCNLKSSFKRDTKFSGENNQFDGSVVLGKNSAHNCTINGKLIAREFAQFKSSIKVSNTSQFDNSITCRGNVNAIYFKGIATSAQWADLAENYTTDDFQPIGTLMQLGGQEEFTIATNQVNGVISQNPAYLMNSGLSGNCQPIALVGRVRVRIINPVQKFDYIGLSDIPGIGMSYGKKKPQNCIGRALQKNSEKEEKLVECIIKLQL